MMYHDSSGWTRRHERAVALLRQTLGEQRFGVPTEIDVWRR